MKKKLRKSEIRELNEKISFFGIEFSKKDDIELDGDILLVNNKTTFFYKENIIVPALRLLLEKPEILPSITVDMGAVRFVTSGADIMRPGILDIDNSIKKDDFCVIIDEKNKKPLAVGQALFDASEMKIMTSGKVVKNIHYVGDKIWNSV